MSGPHLAHLVLVVPGLLPEHRPAIPEPGAQSSAAPGLARLLTLAGPARLEPAGWPAALAAVYGVTRSDDWPFAPLLAATAGLDASNAYWLCADPVELEAGRDDLRLRRLVTDLDPAEAEGLIATCNAHFAGDGLRFGAREPAHWFVRVDAPQRLTTCALPAILGRTLRTRQPTGPDAPRWLRWGNEIQMLLHEHPINQQRAGRGVAPVNSVWFWGGGGLPPRSNVGIDTFALDPVASALAVHARRPARPVPEGLAAVLSRPTVGPGAGDRGASPTTTVVALPESMAPDALEQAWTGPAWRALAAGRLASVTVIATRRGAGDASAHVFCAAPPSLRQRLALLLREPRSLDRLLERLAVPDSTEVTEATR